MSSSVLLACALCQVIASAGSRGDTAAPRAAPPAVARAVAAAEPPVIDGRDRDAVWRSAPAITGFRQFQPVEDAEPSFATEARVAFDARHFYVFVRAFDPRPDSILPLLARRDVRTASDQIKILIDAYRDRRTGYELAVNPAGVKRDFVIYDDANEDGAWDGVWDVATTIDSLGWTAEFRVPLSQLRYRPGGPGIFGFGVWRDIQRYSERVSWPVYRVSKTGLASQLGELHGLDNLPSPRRLEIAPYVLSQSAPRPRGEGGLRRAQSASVGADFRYGLSSSLTLDATVNPDFGQVEADPAVLNLSAFETFFEERRPFFVSGTGVFQLPVNCSQVDCSGENLFYSRRIGREPQLSGVYGDESSPTASTILGAAKLTGRLPSGLTLGLLEAYTGRERGTERRTIEPGANYTVLRAQQDLRRGESNLGILATSVRRDLDRWSEPFLRRDATAAALDFRHRFLGGRYQIKGLLAASRVTGSAEAIAATQTSSVHFFQRPDGEVRLDSTRTSLTGDAEELYLGKVGGKHLLFETSYLRRSPGFEVNDLGFLREAGQQSWSTWVGFQFQQPRWIYRRAFWNVNWWQYWTSEGLPLQRAANTNLHAQLRNLWWLHAGATLSRLGATFCDRCARGGPALRQSRSVDAWGGIEGDDRPVLVPSLWFNGGWRDEGRSRYLGLNPSVRLRVGSPLTTSLGLGYTHNRDDRQWFGNFGDWAGVTHHTFAHLEQKTASITWRVDYTMSPTLSLQLYAQPFVSKGTYSDIRELADPRAAAYTDRFRPYADSTVAADPGGFNFKQFRSNMVLRWEYRPGSTLFLVWNQGRQSFTPFEGSRSLAGDFGDLFGTRPRDTFLIKASYWINR